MNSIRIRAAALCATMTVPITTLPARATVLCRKPSGVVVARDASCKKKEVRLDAAALGFSSGGYTVVDSAGNTLGAYGYDSGSATNVLRREPGHVLSFVLYPSSFNCGDILLYYETPDCSGTPYMDPYALTRHVGIPCDGTTGEPISIGYYAGDPIQTHTIRSEAGGRLTNCGSRGDTIAVGPAVTFDLSPFHPPFHLE